MVRTCLAALLAVLVLPSSAFADIITFKMRSFSKEAVEIVFYSQNRKIEWPGGGKVHLNSTRDVASYPLTCVKDEKICYGAWLKDNPTRYWGMGQGGKQKCADCCYTCGGNTVTKVHTLNEK